MTSEAFNIFKNVKIQQKKKISKLLQKFWYGKR